MTLFIKLAYTVVPGTIFDFLYFQHRDFAEKFSDVFKQCQQELKTPEATHTGDSKHGPPLKGYGQTIGMPPIHYTK